MFGLMRPKSCCSTQKTNDYYQHRIHYCGTCKAIGKNYSHRGRMLLNYDTVFLAELLSALNREKLDRWEEGFQKINQCWSIPAEERLPFSLEYAGTASVLLGELKLDDHIKDSKQFRWKFAKRVYNSTFQKVAQKFEEWGITTTTIYDWIDTQEIREKEALGFDSLTSCLDYYAEATAQITAQIFAAGGARLDYPTDLYDLGFQFGQLMYILDAFEDYEKDIFKKQFNPLAIYWGKQPSLETEQLELVRATILDLQSSICQTLEQLPLHEESILLYSNRLISNLSLRLYRERVVPKTKKEGLQLRWAKAKTLAEQIQCSKPGWIHQLNYYVLVWAVFLNPETIDYLPQEGKMEVFKWTMLITATLASFGLLGVIRKSRKERRAEKRKERRSKRFFRKLKNLFSKKRDCGDCLSSCCSSGCCDGCCSNLDCSGCCEDCDELEWWVWLLIILGCLVAVGLGILIAFLI